MKEFNELTEISKEVRKKILTMAFNAQSAHVGGALSCVEILVALYFKIMKVFPKDPENKLRDRFVFSKAHDGKALFAVLAQRGFFNKKILNGYEMNNGLLPGHSTRHCVPGIEVSAGSLGHGLSMAVGMSLALKKDKKKQRVFAMLSDGECDEGSTWEAILFAGHHKLDNLIVIIDYNKLQGFGFTKDILNLEPFAKKFKDFGWSTREIDGHNFSQIISTLRTAPFIKGKPSLVIAHTIKGFGGVEKHVNQISSQYKPPTDEEFKEVLQTLENI